MMHLVYIFFFNLYENSFQEVSIIPLVQKWLREVQSLVLRHTASEWHNLNLNKRALYPKCIPFPGFCGIIVQRGRHFHVRVP